MLVKIISRILLLFTTLTLLTISRGHSNTSKTCKIYKCRSKVCCNFVSQG